MRHLRLTEQQLDAMRKRGKPKTVDQMKVNKYGNKRKTVDGIDFQSGKEAKRWQELRLLESTGRITQIERQVRYELKVKGVHVADYVADFVVVHDGGTIEVMDVKGYRKGAAYAMFRLKAKLMLACYGVEVKEIGL